MDNVLNNPTILSRQFWNNKPYTLKEAIKAILPDLRKIALKKFTLLGHTLPFLNYLEKETGELGHAKNKLDKNQLSL